MNTLLIFPPDWLPTQPYLSIPCLTGYLRKHGYNVEQRDLNIEVIDHLLSKKYIKESYAKITDKKKANLYSAEHDIWLNKLELTKDILFSVDEAKENLKNSDMFLNDLETYMKNVNTVALAFEAISLANDPDKISFCLYTSEISSIRSQEIIFNLKHNDDNLFYQLYKKEFVESLLKNNPDFIGISVIATAQVIPSLYLCRALKEAKPDIHICLGGNLVSRWKDQLPLLKDLFNYFDSLIIHEGEGPLVQLFEALEGKREMRDVPNLVYYDSQKEEIIVNESVKPVNINELPTPDFSDYPLNLYLAPELSLPLLTSRGCYWGKCAFCDHFNTWGCLYSKRKMEYIIQDIKSLNEQLHCQNFAFVDECLAPVTVERLSERLIKEDLNLSISCEIRLEKQFADPELWKKAYLAGFRTVYYGLESANQRVLDLMKKNVKRENFMDIFRSVAEAGLWNHTFVFFGFPGETEEESAETIQFLKDNSKYIYSMTFGEYNLNKYSDVARNSQCYPVEKYELAGDMAVTHRFQYTNGRTTEDVLRFVATVNPADIFDHEFVRFTKFIYRDLWPVFLRTKFITDIREQLRRLPLGDLQASTYLKLTDSCIYGVLNDGLYVYNHKINVMYQFSLNTKMIFDLLREGLTWKELIDSLLKTIPMERAYLEDECCKLVSLLDKELLFERRC